MPAGNWIRSACFSTHQAPSGMDTASGIASIQRTGSMTRSSSNSSGIEARRKPSGSNRMEKATRHAMTINGLVQRVPAHSELNVGPPSPRAAIMIVKANKHIRMPVKNSTKPAFGSFTLPIPRLAPAQITKIPSAMLAAPLHSSELSHVNWGLRCAFMVKRLPLRRLWIQGVRRRQRGAPCLPGRDRLVGLLREPKSTDRLTLRFDGVGHELSIFLGTLVIYDHVVLGKRSDHCGIFDRLLEGVVQFCHHLGIHSLGACDTPW